MRKQIATSALLLGIVLFATPARGEGPVVKGADGEGAAPGPGDPAETGRKLSNPLSEVWALFTEFALSSSDGQMAAGDEQVGGRMVFQPIIPLPLYGSGENQWRLITRPTIPVLFRQPIPTGPGMFDHKTGIGDTQVPLVISPAVPNWILGAGPTWLLPTATKDEFGRDQWGVGPAAVLGYYNDDVTVGAFGQYFFGLGSPDDSSDDASYLHLLYFVFYNLPDAWQIGFAPTITYDRRAMSDNKWNVPVGLTVSKTADVGGMLAKFELGIEYSVVSQDAFGQRASIKLSVIPVIPSLIRKPLFGGQ